MTDNKGKKHHMGCHEGAGKTSNKRMLQSFLCLIRPSEKGKKDNNSFLASYDLNWCVDDATKEREQVSFFISVGQINFFPLHFASKIKSGLDW